MLAFWLILRKLSPKSTLSCRKILAKFNIAFWENSTKVYAFFMQDFHQNVCRFVRNIPQNLAKWENLLCWKISKKISFLGKFSQKNCCIRKFKKICFVGKFPQNFALWENFHKTLLCWKISTILFLEIFTKKFSVKKFQNLLYWSISTTN